MPKYVFIYHAPPMPADAPPPDPDDVQNMMDAWYGWADSVGDALIDLGTPLGGGIHVEPDGVSLSTKEVAGYTILTADSMDAAVALAQAHPHLTMPGGCSIEVHEAMPLPGE
ncbi:YciI family protein [Demequina mangrovi]|uniref:YCII-related domain-containing protein n=1 Tax=Demequina mangrovi TaxID=1043493 RepID=A0A1H6ZCT7_9MICO|nr:YciI family protein [Demequina mangrovi]SEJ50536.1 YCII-related domain-containing protein [Demequina mangrovi]